MQAKKKLTALLLSLCMVLGMLPMTVFAAGGTTTSGLTYEDNGDSVTITGYTGSEGNVTIPSEIEGKPVTAIGERAFSQNKTLTSVAIPDSVTGIGDYAFYMTWSLTSIEIPDGVTGIGKSAFYESGLENINIPAGVTTIGMGAFEDCFNLSGVTFEKDSKLTEIESGTFSCCVKLTSIEIPAGVTSIGIMAFNLCSDLTSVTFEEGSQLSSIREGAFYWCMGLTDITFTGNTAPELEADNVFDECAALTAIHVPCGADGYTAANGWPEDKVQREHVWAEDWTSDGTHHWKACTAEGCAEKDQYGVHQIANGVCTVCKAEVETSGVQTYAVKVNGITVTSANASDILGDADGDGATAYYDPAANTLTLDNAQLTSSGFGAVWAQEENFTLVLKGENQITGEGDFPHSAVYSHGAMTVKGNGSLTTSGTYFGLFGNNTITIEDGASVDLTVDFSSDEQDQPYAAVRAIGGLTVDGATLNAKNNATQDAGFGTPGINTDLTAINGAKVNISSVNDHGICGDVIVSGAGTVVNASSASGEHYGIFAGQEDIFGGLGGDQKGIFTISDGAVVTASGGKGAMRWKPDLSGYTDPVVAAGDSAAAEEIIGDPAGTEYQNEKYVQVRSSLEPVEPTESTDPTDPTTPTDPTEPTDPAKPEQQGKPSGQTESPQTGDNSDMALWIGLMLASCGGVLGILGCRRKKVVVEE
ncbi:leucine-rich repeat protein [[Clostridium] spiroforme]|nr:leucine-rich repeat protein [Thomasclavelia spiroformis]